MEYSFLCAGKGTTNPWATLACLFWPASYSVWIPVLPQHAADREPCGIGGDGNCRKKRLLQIRPCVIDHVCEVLKARTEENYVILTF